MSAESLKLAFYVCAGLCTVFALLAGWYANALGRTRAELKQKARELAIKSQELSRSNSTLGEESVRKAEELEASRLAALNMMQDAEEAREKAESTALALTREMEERKKIENQLMQSQKMETVGTLAGGIAHDLNNQLTPVKGYIDLILSGTKPEDPNYPLLMEANMSVERCAEVIHRLLNFSRTSAQKKSVLSVAKIFGELKGLTQKFLPSTITVEMECPDGLYPVAGNETEVETVFMNLATNARDAMPDGGTLRFEAKNVNLGETAVKSGRPQGEFVLVTVSDSGTGIPPHILNRIFEPFFTTKKKGEGTGLGLAMVFKIVKDSGGWLDVSSLLGKGTTFQIYLPARPDAILLERREPSADIGAMLANGETILFADDEEMIRKMARILLEKLGYKVLMASDAEEVVAIFREKHASIDALLVDMTMPKLTGKQMLQKIFEIDPRTKVIIASGYASEVSHREMRDLGASDFIQKPYTIVPMAKCLRAVLTGSCPLV